MDPLAFALGIILGGGALGGGVALGRREAVGLRQQVAGHAQVERESLRQLEEGLDALRHRVQVQGREIGQAISKTAELSEQLEQEHSLTMRLSEVVDQQQREREAVTAKLSSQLEQLEAFASRAATEVNDLRQRLMAAGYPVMVPMPAAQPVMMTPQQAAAASPADLIAGARAAQEVFARRQREAMAGAFQQPPGGQ